MTGVWLIIRLTGIALGVITLLGFASGYLGVEFKPYFKNVLDWLEKHLVDFIVRPEEIEWALDYLRQHFAWVPKPEPYWKPLYTLTTLYMLSWARRGWWYEIPIALMCSLVSAVFAGTMTLGSIAVILWPVAGIGAYFAITALPDWGWRDAGEKAAFAASSAAVGYLFGAIDLGVLSLVTLVAIVVAFSFDDVLIGLRGTEGTIWQRLQDKTVNIGLDVIGTVGLALALGLLFAA